MVAAGQPDLELKGTCTYGGILNYLRSCSGRGRLIIKSYSTSVPMNTTMTYTFFELKLGKV
jgi:hypothetical protein